MTTLSTTNIKSLIVVDSRVTDWQSLIGDIDPNATFIVIDPLQNGLAQIAQAVADLKDLDTIHIISHGNVGSLQLGSTTLNSQNLSDFQAQLSTIGNALTSTGDILLYGCNVAQGDTGLTFINQLSKLTGADIAASTNLTGNAALGGDWVLEANTGVIESVTPFNVAALQNYSNVLVVPKVNITAGVTPVEGGTVGTFTITLDSAPVSNLVVNYTLDGASTATLATDYTVTAGTNISAVTVGSFTILAGQTTATININALTDVLLDPNETVIMKLATGTGYKLAATNSSSFAPKVDYTTGTKPYSVTTGDFNLDGKLDIAVANDSSITVSVLLGTGSGTFAPKVDSVTGTNPTVTSGDFNGDGILDLAVANYSANTVSVLLGTGFFGQFANKVDYATGGNPYSVTAGDFNGDGKLDLAVANSSTNTVSVLLGTGGGTFAAKVDYATGVGPASVTTGDFNGDGKLDIAVTNDSANTVSVLLGTGSGTFVAKVDYATGTAPTSVTTGDFNGDGKLDMAVANFNANTVSVLLGTGSGTFAPKVDYATGAGPSSVTTGDFNGDGRFDMVVTNFNANTVSVLLNNAAPSATLTITNITVPTLTTLTALTGTEDVQKTIAFADLTAVANAADVDGTVTAFVVKVVSTGTLLINGTAWAAGTNDIIDASHTAAWTGAQDANGLLNAFTVVAQDNSGANSATPVQVQVNTTAVNDAPTATNLSATEAYTEDTSLNLTDIVITDPDTGDNITVTLTLSDTAAGSLTTTTSGAVTSTYDANTGVWSASGTLADVNTLLVGVSLTPAVNFNGNFTVVTSVSDGIATPVTGVKNFTGTPVPDVSITAGTTPVEGGTVGTFTITLDSVPASDLVVNYTLDGASTATLATDYTVTAGTNISAVTAASFTILAGQTTATININALADVLVDPNETVIMNLAAGTGYQLATASAQLTITDMPNTPPVLTTPATVTYTDTVFVDTFATATGTLSGSDTTGSTLTYGITGGTDIGNVVIKSNTYGTLAVAKATGAYIFIANSAGIEPLAADTTDNTLEVTVSDGSLTDKKTFTVTILQSGTTESDGNDNLIGTTGNDIINALAGDDSIDGGAGSDVINGGLGNDSLDGGVSDVLITGVTDTLNGDAGNDTFLVRGFFGAGNYDGGLDNDTLDFSLSDAYTSGRRTAEGAGVSVNLATHKASTYYQSATNFTWANAAGQIAVTNIENVKGTAQGDVLNGDSANNLLDGGAGNDVLYGVSGIDTLVGGDGNDTYYIGYSGDVIDVITESSTSGTNDKVLSYISSYTLANNVETLVLQTGAVTGIGNAGNNTLIGNAVNNVLNGASGVDKLIGGAGNDMLTGGLGKDLLTGGTGKDTYLLAESTLATDTINITTGDSLISSFDVAKNFTLGKNAIKSTGVDQLNLVSTKIAANVAAVNGVNVGTVMSHHISKGIISFDDVNSFAAPVAINASNLNSVISYLHTNITAGNTVAFTSGADTYVFQDGGVTDTLVELVGITATSVNNTGLAAGAVWVV